MQILRSLLTLTVAALVLFGIQWGFYQIYSEHLWLVVSPLVGYGVGRLSRRYHLEGPWLALPLALIVVIAGVFSIFLHGLLSPYLNGVHDFIPFLIFGLCYYGIGISHRTREQAPLSPIALLGLGIVWLLGWSTIFATMHYPMRLL